MRSNNKKMYIYNIQGWMQDEHRSGVLGMAVRAVMLAPSPRGWVWEVDVPHRVERGILHQNICPDQLQKHL